MGKLIYLPGVQRAEYAKQHVSKAELEWIYGITDGIIDHIQGGFDPIDDSIIEGLVLAYQKGKWMGAKND